MTSLAELMVQLQAVPERNDSWGRFVNELDQSDHGVGLHLAIFVEPYLRFILEGRKTIESRFSLKPLAPYSRVAVGDVLLLKRAGGPVRGVCRVANVWSYRLDPKTWNMIRRDFADEISPADEQFWRERESAKYATLMRVTEVRSMPSLHVRKRDRRGWVVLKASSHGRESLWNWS